MRKISGILAVFILLASLSACGQSTEAQWQKQYDLGVRYLSEGNYEEAIIAFAAAIEINDKRPEAYIGRGDAYFGVKDYPSAESDYNTAKDLDSARVEVYDRLADLYVQTGDLERALQILREGYEATGDQGLLTRLQSLEKLNELPDLPTDLLAASIVVSMYSADHGFEGHDAYQFDDQGRMTSNTWYGSDNQPIVQETWVYDDTNNTATNTRGEIDEENGQWVVMTATEEGTENRGWYWYGMGASGNEYITDPTMETENGRLLLDSGWADYGYDAQGRAITIHTYRETGELIGYCVVTYTR